MNRAQGSNPIIKIPQGTLEGFLLHSRKRNPYYGFYGIPYGKTERFELPKQWESWNGVLNATRAKERCLQIKKTTKEFIGSETNCLFLNVFTPAFPLKDPNDQRGLPATVPKNELYPVIFFIHGGGFEVGGGDLYGNKFLVDEKVIMVHANYRLGALGYLNLGDGLANFGLHDQVMALRWVQENIRYFSGDPQNVILMGESAGAACVHFHMMSELSKGLFCKAIMQSGTALRELIIKDTSPRKCRVHLNYGWMLPEPYLITKSYPSRLGSVSPWAFNYAPAEKLKKLLKRLDINGFSSNNKTEMLHKLKRIDAKAIVAQRVDYEQLKDDLPVIHFAPSIECGPKNDKKFLTESPIQILNTGKIVNEVPIIMGINAQEGLYRSLPILRDSTRLKALNDHWSHELPRHLMYKKEAVSQHEDFAKSIRRFYFDSKSILDSADARERLTNLISDRLFIYPTKKTALLHRAFTKDPANKMYLYNFRYCGDYSYLNGFEVHETYGACHADELQYLMNQRIFYSKITPGSQADEIIDKMVGLWGSFAWTGVPEYNRQSRPWEPIPLKTEALDAKLRYFCIDKVDGMIDEPFTDRMNFWDHAPSLLSNL